MTPENSSALPTIARIPSEASPQTSSDATAIEAGLRDAPGSSRGSSGWSLTEPTDDAVHGVPTDGPARHRSTTPQHNAAAGRVAAGTVPAETVAFWEEQALRLDWAETPSSPATGSPTGSGKPWHTAHRRVPADVEAGIGPPIADLAPAAAQANLARVGWAPERSAARSIDEAAREGCTHVGDDWRAQVAHPAIDEIGRASCRDRVL